MTAKVTIQDIIDAGFRAEQFGTPLGDEAASWNQADGYVDRLLTRVERWARGRLGVQYDAIEVITPQGEALRSAELCWAKAQLWNRRAGFVDSNAATSLDNMAYLNRREYEAQAERAAACAESFMQQVIDPTEPVGIAIGIAAAERGPWFGGSSWP
ncbi:MULTISPECIES: hypothetical protein [Xanthomonas]|uniref:hypothetical protein n=1 Tax=Xanthomonas TaxID=338 RepID=UPI000E1F2112|nr:MULTISPECIES: hypothetical protein [Xanthomonas]